MAARVLIADDSPVARVSVARRVRAAGIDVVEEASAAGAAAVDASELACALLDLELGDGDGTDVAVQLRSQRVGLPVAFFSSASDGPLVARAKTLGPIFEKPDGLDAAIAWVRAHFGA